MTVAIIGDIHGNLDALTRLIESKEVSPVGHLIFLGDYIGKGRNSKEVIDFLLELSRERKCTFLLGNHEVMLMSLLRCNPVQWSLSHPRFLMRTYHQSMVESCENLYLAHSSNGFIPLADSYGLDFTDLMINDDEENFQAILERKRKEWIRMIPKNHLRFFLGLLWWYYIPGFVMVHAGLSAEALSCDTFRKALTTNFELNPSSFILERETEGTPKKFPEVLVHGHTPLLVMARYYPDCPYALDYWKQGRPKEWMGKLCIDTAAFALDGYLTAFLPDSNEFIQVPAFPDDKETDFDLMV
ncbi:MAG TPA: metallophosphoesterase [Oligoflexia bacterium]|nr:metallophosphoesterase [Oligoflexia bacterium]HMP47885.1 metallophosphoesterase [Oligoflexia bacterium]